ncbi:hypothetical protein OII53_28045 [Achromobacter ruhlandii]|uniref:hypothetical protein n=1 Tax=Achromobacter ruhlandii TaxID=72557 RepID=UPI0021F20091|nr:hypothetical protein [Achromobacter ruhlandii]MCV6799839.1 hypothetical protein [Achromobacter ruhlandii]MCV6801451.1 hypothetical protein [Achromobacter ruhlandii]MCV6812314.1 hypothetical protein [Achromobacter ruhlandii]MCV6822427.1 hypothetical protein [Achromobacter ruhlandii]
MTISAEGRDQGKVFVLTELSAYEAEDWAGRALFALMNAGVQIPENIAQAGLAGVAALGMTALTKLPYESAKPLLDKMMECVEIQPSAKVTRRLIADDIEEVATLLTLRKHVLGLHMDFSMAAAKSTSGSRPGTAAARG